MAETSLRVSYERLDAGRPLEDDVLLAVDYASSPRIDDPRCLTVPLTPLGDCPTGEVWRGGRPVRSATDGDLHYAEDGDHVAGWLTVQEDLDGADLTAITERAYRDILNFHAQTDYRHIWRMWNFISDINQGVDDDERYRRFCQGRARAFRQAMDRGTIREYPAASAIGKKTPPRSLQVCWIGSRHGASILENPRQVSAFEYPRQYGPASPSFSRAAVAPTRMFLVSGTASIIGHESRHQGDLAAQIGETFKNLEALASTAAAQKLIGTRPFDRSSVLKAYLRDPESALGAKAEIQQRLGPDAGLMILAADICRSELLIEIELVHQG